MLSLRAQNMVESLMEVVNDLADELSKTHESVTVMINIDASRPEDQSNSLESRF